MNRELTSSDFLQENFFTADDNVTEYIELPIVSKFNQFYKIKRFGRWFLLKGLKEEYASQAMYVLLLKKEFNLSVELDHPNIVTTIQKEDNPKVGPAILMEYIDGMRLDEFLATAPTFAQRRRIVGQLLDAMQYFHSKQIVHRDLKPSNLLVTHNGFNLKIIDFGLADADSYAVFKQPAGTKSYAAPEQMEIGSVVDCRADIYSFGLILHEIFPKRYGRVVKKCVMRESVKRYADVGQIEKALNCYDRVRRLVLPFVLFLLCMVMVMFVGLVVGKEVASDYYFNQGDPENILVQNQEVTLSYTDSEQVVLAAAFADLDSLYKPYMDSLSQGFFEYREFALGSLSLKSKRQGDILRYYSQQISVDSPFYGSFMSSFSGYVANNYYNEAVSLCELLPSFFLEYREGRLSVSEYEGLKKEYDEFLQLE